MTNENIQNEVTVQPDEKANVLTTAVRETDDYQIIQDENGKYSRKAKYKDYSSIQATDRKTKMWLLNIMEGDEETGNGLKSHVGKEIEVQDIITRKYDRINEETGEIEYGVLTYLIDPDKNVYVTSSKTVYFSIDRIMSLFGTPDSEIWENVILHVYTTKGQYGDIIKVKMVG